MWPKGFKALVRWCFRWVCVEIYSRRAGSRFNWKWGDVFGQRRRQDIVHKSSTRKIDDKYLLLKANVNKQKQHHFHKVSYVKRDFTKTLFNRNNCKSQLSNKIWKTWLFLARNCHGNAASDISTHRYCISVCHMVGKLARVNIRIAIPSTTGQFTVTSWALAALAHQQNIYIESARLPAGLLLVLSTALSPTDKAS